MGIVLHCDSNYFSQINFKYLKLNFMKHFFLILAFIASTFSIKAQSHNTNCDCCKYSKNYAKNCKNLPNESKPCGCPACSEQKKKEEAFKKAEDKRINDAIVAKKNAEQAAKKKAEDEAYRKKLEEDRKLAEGTKVSIVSSSNNNKSNGKVTNNEKKQTIMMGFL